MAEAKLTQVKTREIKPSPYQVRERFDDKGIEELAKSIHMHGLLHPILVRPTKGKLPYELVHGERRWRAVQKLGKNRILGYIQRLSDLEAQLATLVENVQREDLKPYEMAKALKRLRDVGLSTGDIAKRTGKAEEWVRDLIGFEEEASPFLKRAVERYYEGGSSGTLRSVQKSSLPAVPIKVGVAIKRATHDLPKLKAKATQERFAETISKHDFSLPDAEKTLSIWRHEEGKISPEKAAKIVARQRDEEQEKAADVVWIQLDKELQDGVKVIMARENLPNVRETVLYLVRYALEEMDVIETRR